MGEVEQRLEERVLQPITDTSWRWYVWTLFLLLLSASGIVAYSHQVRKGLAVTGMRDTVIWGLYITNFVFFIGISHAGTLISAILRVTQAEWRRPVTRMAEVITAVALMIGGLMPIIDLGRPDRIPNMLLHGQIGSPIIWDFISITTYLTGSLIYLYLPLIPDIALARDRLKGKIGRLRWRLYAILSLGWEGTPEQRRYLERAIGVMMILIIPIAVSVHTVVSWIFAMTLRAGWNSTIFGPYFVVGAIYSGIAGIITVMYVFRRIYHLEDYITEKHFRYLAYLLLALGVIYLYFTFAEYLTTAYKLQEGEKLLLEELMLGKFAASFWTFVIAGLVVPILLIILPWTRTVPLIVLASVLVNIGMWIKRFVIVVPSLALPLMPSAWGVYTPTWVELAITAAAFGGLGLIFTLFAKFFPIISVWEMEEGWEQERARAAAGPASTGMVAGPAIFNPEPGGASYD
ncbi:MAG: polysulfide reductase NrfD [Ardenticatenaceae bacterium]|nr:polysulfide reductase NrfD [Ardenticatenaceae bacterium]